MPETRRRTTASQLALATTRISPPSSLGEGTAAKLVRLAAQPPTGGSSSPARDELRFHAPGLIEGDRDSEGKLPSLSGGTLSEAWIMLGVTLNQPSTLAIYRYAATAPSTPVLVATIAVPAGELVTVARDLGIGMSPGDGLRATLGFATAPTAGADLTITLRVM